MKILIACECSQTICIEFRKLGAECYSCDIEPQYGGHDEWYIQSDVLQILETPCFFTTCDVKQHEVDKWDLIIAHPPCTFLSNAQLKYYNDTVYPKDYVEKRKKNREEAINFFLKFTKLKVPTVIENPPGIMSRIFRKPSQVIQPYFFGDNAQKATCLWMLNGVPLLEKTNDIGRPEVHHTHGLKGTTMSQWMYETSLLRPKDRAKVRSKTFPGVAKAIATQFMDYLNGPRQMRLF